MHFALSAATVSRLMELRHVALTFALPWSPRPGDHLAVDAAGRYYPPNPTIPRAVAGHSASSCLRGAPLSLRG